MKSLQAVCADVPGLTEAQLTQWLQADYVRPSRQQGQLMFSDADLARVRLIVDLRVTLEVEEPTVPLVLALLDQLYATRWQLRRVLQHPVDPPG